MKKLTLITPALFLIPTLAQAEEAENTWADQQHASVKGTLHDWSNDINEWLGETDPSRPASATLRIMADNQWNKFDGYSIKPRIRAKIKLPVLKKHLSIVIGDEDLDNQARDKSQISPNYRQPLASDKRYDSKQTRYDNNSIALRWSTYKSTLGIESDIDAGIRSGSDVFGRLRVSKEWKWDEMYSTRLEQIYRYGSESKHYLRTNLENKRTEDEKTFINNHTYIEYTHDIDEETVWGNTLYRQHDFKNFKRLSYGLYAGGSFKKDKSLLNAYGPFISYRQPIIRKWVFIQPEINFYNNKDKDRSHTLGAFLRVEVIF